MMDMAQPGAACLSVWQFYHTSAKLSDVGDDVVMLNDPALSAVYRHADVGLIVGVQAIQIAKLFVQHCEVAGAVVVVVHFVFPFFLGTDEV